LHGEREEEADVVVSTLMTWKGLIDSMNFAKEAEHGTKYTTGVEHMAPNVGHQPATILHDAVQLRRSGVGPAVTTD